ncbi:MAG: FAD-dependent oxidoreductase [Burkholderiaceae bacterium]
MRSPGGPVTRPPSIQRVAHDAGFAPTARVPLLIVGAGACGLVAALRAKALGLEVAVLERDALPAGSTALSSGFIPACDTRVQRRAGIDDSVDRFVADITAKAGGRNDSSLTEAYVRAIGPALDWLGEVAGLPFELLEGFVYPGHSRLRMHAVPERTGRGLIDRLLKAAADAGIDLLTNARVVDLIADAHDRILGVRLQRPDGREETIGCDTLLLACNGYGGNPERIAAHIPEMRDAVFAGHVGNDGSALAWGEALGAASADLSGYQGHGSWASPHGMLITWALMTEGGIQVDVHGDRFHDESLGYSEAAMAVLAQDGGVAWNVFDAPLLALARGFPDFVAAQRAGALRSADDVAGLATTLGVDSARLATTLRELEALADSGEPDRFGRRFRRPLRAPLYAIRVTGALFHTQGGLVVDCHCRVLRPNGSALPNLLAAGGSARGVSGDTVWGYLSGNGLLSAVAGGWIAAGSLAAQG